MKVSKNESTKSYNTDVGGELESAVRKKTRNRFENGYSGQK